MLGHCFLLCEAVSNRMYWCILLNIHLETKPTMCNLEHTVIYSIYRERNRLFTDVVLVSNKKNCAVLDVYCIVVMKLVEIVVQTSW